MTQLRQEETAAFVDKVARRLREAGMAVKTNVEKIAGMRVTRPNGRDPAGDLDVLAAHSKRNVLYVRETKDLEGARTGRVQQRVAGKLAVDGEKRSAADRHLDLEQVLEHLGLSPMPAGAAPEDFVVDIEVLSPYVAECPPPITPIERLLEELGESNAMSR